MYSNTNDDLYAIPHKENNNNNNPSEGLYDAPCDLEEPAPVIQNKYTIQYHSEVSYCDTNESYAVVDRNNRHGNDTENDDTIQRNADKNIGNKCLKTKSLSRTIRRLSNILLIVLVVGLATTSYMIYNVESKVGNTPDHEEVTRLAKEMKEVLRDVKRDDEKFKRDVNRDDKKFKREKQMESNTTLVEVKRHEARLEKEMLHIQINSNQTKDDLSKMKIQNVVMKKKINGINLTSSKNSKKFSNLEKLSNETVEDVEVLKEKAKIMNRTLFQLRMLKLYEEKYKEDLYGIYGISFQDHAECKQTVLDVMWLTNQHDDDDMFILRKLKKEFKDFEDMWGNGSMKGALNITHRLDFTKRKKIFDSLRHIKVLDRLKFVESPKKTTSILGKFGEDKHGIYVEGFVNVKADDKWHPIYFEKCSDPKGMFGNNEAKVTCKDGGYSSGTFVTYERDYNGLSPTLKYVEVVCSGKEQQLRDCHYKIHDFNHWLSNVEVKCYL